MAVVLHLAFAACGELLSCPEYAVAMTLLENAVWTCQAQQCTGGVVCIAGATLPSACSWASGGSRLASGAAACSKL